MLIILVLFTIALGIYPSIVLDSLQYTTQGLLHTFSLNVAYADSSESVREALDTENITQAADAARSTTEPEDNARNAAYAASHNVERLPSDVIPNTDQSNLPSALGDSNCLKCIDTTDAYDLENKPAFVHLSCGHSNQITDDNCHNCGESASKYIAEERNNNNNNA